MVTVASIVFHIDVWAGAQLFSVSRTLTFPLAALGYGHCAGLTLDN